MQSDVPLALWKSVAASAAARAVQHSLLKPGKHVPVMSLPASSACFTAYAAVPSSPSRLSRPCRHRIMGVPLVSYVYYATIATITSIPAGGHAAALRSTSVYHAR